MRRIPGKVRNKTYITPILTSKPVNYHQIQRLRQRLFGIYTNLSKYSYEEDRAEYMEC